MNVTHSMNAARDPDSHYSGLPKTAWRMNPIYKHREILNDLADLGNGIDDVVEPICQEYIPVRFNYLESELWT